MALPVPHSHNYAIWEEGEKEEKGLSSLMIMNLLFSLTTSVSSSELPQARKRN